MNILSSEAALEIARTNKGNSFISLLHKLGIHQITENDLANLKSDRQSKKPLVLPQVLSTEQINNLKLFRQTIFSTEQEPNTTAELLLQLQDAWDHYNRLDLNNNPEFMNWIRSCASRGLNILLRDIFNERISCIEKPRTCIDDLSALGYCALHLAILRKHVATVNTLVNELHADLNITTPEGNTSYKLAESQGTPLEFINTDSSRDSVFIPSSRTIILHSPQKCIPQARIPLPHSHSFDSSIRGIKA